VIRKLRRAHLVVVLIVAATVLPLAILALALRP
jgi:hypothetical protein